MGDDATLAGPGGWRAAASTAAWCVRAGLLVGLAFGLVQAAGLSWSCRSFMGARQACDVLSYSALAHGILWVLYATALGVGCALAGMVARRFSRATSTGAMAAAGLAAGGVTFLVWMGALAMGVSPANGLETKWCLGMTIVWLVTAVLVYGAARRLLGTWLARWLAGVVRWGTWAGAAILVVCSVVQWFERPRLMTGTIDWRHPPSAPTDRRDRRPNIVLIVLDTQRVDRLGCYGYDRPTTPRLDAFAAEAAVFDRCISPAIWTLPAHASMFTGLFPSEHGANYNHRWLRTGFKTMAEELAAMGYETVAFSNNVWVSEGSNLTRGFQRVVRPTALHRPRGNSVHAFFDKVLRPGGHVGKVLGRLTDRDEGGEFTNELVARWLDERNPRRAFFLFVNYMEPHWPYRPYAPHRRAFVKPEDLDASYRCAWDNHIDFCLLKKDCYTADELRILNDTYDAESRLLDDYVGELLEILARRAPLDETLVIITADHGENLGDHHLLDHVWCVYDTLAHVPLIIRYPERLRPGRRGELVQLTDLLPTVLDAVKGRPARTASTFGRSLLPPRGAGRRNPPTTTAGASRSMLPGLADRVAVTERMAPKDIRVEPVQYRYVAFDRTPFLGVLRAIRQGSWKYIVAADGREELYDLARDPGEADNVIDAHRPIARQLASRLREWLARSKPYRPPGRAGTAPRLKREMQDRLRDLGYLK